MARQLAAGLILPPSWDCDFCHKSYSIRDDADKCCNNYMHVAKRYEMEKYELCDFTIPGSANYQEIVCRYIRIAARTKQVHRSTNVYHSDTFITQITPSDFILNKIRNMQFQPPIDYDTVDQQNVILLEDFISDTPEDRYFYKK